MAIPEISAKPLFPLHIKYLLSSIVHKGYLVLLIGKDNPVSNATEHCLKTAFACFQFKSPLLHHGFQLMGIFSELLLRPLPFGYIPADPYGANHLSILVPEERKGEADINDFAILPHKLNIIVAYYSPMLNNLIQFASLLFLVVIVNHKSPNDLFTLISKNPLCPFIKGNDTSFQICCDIISFEYFRILSR